MEYLLLKQTIDFLGLGQPTRLHINPDSHRIKMAEGIPWEGSEVKNFTVVAVGFVFFCGMAVISHFFAQNLMFVNMTC